MTSDLAEATREYRRLEEQVREVGEADLRATAGAHRSFLTLLDRYEDRATGSGFQEYLEFQDAVADLMDDVDEDVPAYDAFEAADDAVEQRRLSAKDFDRARDRLSPAAEYADLLSDWEAARDRVRAARGAARDRLAELDDAIAEQEHLLELGDVDLDAPVERLRDPIDAYDEAVRAAFTDLRRDAPARDVFDLVGSTDQFPLVGFRSPPPRLHEYLRAAPVGEESVTRVLELADYSASKLSHYVEDPGEFTRHVATNRTYLMELDGEPLTVGYPPPPADEVRYLTREVLAVCNRFAPEPVTAALRRVRDLPRETDYDRLHRAAEARMELGPDQRERLASGEVAAELDRLRTERADLAQALEETPDV